MKNRYKFIIFIVCTFFLAFSTCVTNPLTGENTIAFVRNDELFPMSFQQYGQFLRENTVITGTPEAEMVRRVGNNLRMAAERWLASEGQSSYLQNYQWEFNLIESNEVNAWCMPGGKIVVYTGLLPIAGNEDGLAVVMGHEIAHALLNHGQQRVSGNMAQQTGALAVGIGASVLFGGDARAQSTVMAIYGLGSTVAGTLPFSRRHESEADLYGLILMTIAGYNPNESIPFWQRMSAESGFSLEFLSTHPSDATRIRQLQDWIPEARERAFLINAQTTR